MNAPKVSVYRDRLSNGGSNAFAAHPLAEPKLFSISRVTKFPCAPLLDPRPVSSLEHSVMLTPLGNQTWQNIVITETATPLSSGSFTYNLS